MSPNILELNTVQFTVTTQSTGGWTLSQDISAELDYSLMRQIFTNPPLSE